MMIAYGTYQSPAIKPHDLSGARKQIHCPATRSSEVPPYRRYKDLENFTEYNASYILTYPRAAVIGKWPRGAPDQIE